MGGGRKGGGGHSAVMWLLIPFHGMSSIHKTKLVSSCFCIPGKSVMLFSSFERFLKKVALSSVISFHAVAFRFSVFPSNPCERICSLSLQEGACGFIGKLTKCR